MPKYNKIVIGFDQSYINTGVGIAADNKLLNVTSFKDKFRGLKSPSDKRKCISIVLHELIKKSLNRASEVTILCERIRTFSGGGKGKQKGFISMNYIKSTGALIATIVDVAHEYNIKVHSVDTRSWKSKVIGNSKSVGKDKKSSTIKFVKNLGFDVEYTTKTGLIKFDDDAADSGCIALYGFLPKGVQKLKLEK